MRYCKLPALFGILLLASSGLSLAAKKYYPPGVTPPSEHKPAEEAPHVVIPPVVNTQVIIKTVPVIKAVQKDPLDVLLDEHRYYDALRLLDTRLKKSPQNVSMQLLKGRILREQGNYDLSIAQFQQIQEKNKARGLRAQAFMGLGWTYFRKSIHEKQWGDLESMAESQKSAEHAFKQSLQFSPNSAESWAGLGRVYIFSENMPVAEKAVKRAMHLAPNALQPQLAQAKLLIEKNKSEDALPILYGLKKTITHEPDIYLMLAKASLKTNRVDDAIINLKQLLELVPEHTGALQMLSDAYELKMMPDDAEQVLQKAISINPSDEKSVDALLKIYEQRGEQERAILWLKTLLKERPNQVAYIKKLLERLELQQRWNEAYQDSVAILPSLLSSSGVSSTEKEEIAHIISMIIYQRNKGMLDPQPVLKEPAVQQLQVFLRETLQEKSKASVPHMTEWRDLLLISPLEPTTGIDFPSQPEKDLIADMLQAAYLSGNYKQADRLLAAVQNRPELWIPLAQQLLQIDEYDGALALIEQVTLYPAKVSEQDRALARNLEQQVKTKQKQLKEHVVAIGLLSKKIPRSYFEKAANEVLLLGFGDSETHAVLAKALEKRNELSLAYRQQQLAALYAQSAKERSSWQGRATKTLHRLKSPGK